MPHSFRKPAFQSRGFFNIVSVNWPTLKIPFQCFFNCGLVFFSHLPGMLKNGIPDFIPSCLVLTHELLITKHACEEIRYSIPVGMICRIGSHNQLLLIEKIMACSHGAPVKIKAGIKIPYRSESKLSAGIFKNKNASGCVNFYIINEFLQDQIINERT